MSDEDPIVAYLAGDTSVSLDPAELAEMEKIRIALADGATWVEPDASLQQRIIEAVAADLASTPSRAAETSTPPSQPATVTHIAHHRSRRMRYSILGIAAAVVLAVGLAVGLVVALSGQGSRTVAYSASLTGTQLEPSASGTAQLTRTQSGWRIHVKATGLPRRDNGEYYEAWLKNPAGVIVPIGTFNEGADVTLWAGVPPSSFPTLTITRQTVGGGPASSGQVVLLGTTQPDQ
jgi:hypothetical protein